MEEPPGLAAGRVEAGWSTGPVIPSFQYEAGQRLIEFCQENALVTANTGDGKGRGARDQMPTSAGSSKKQEGSRKRSVSALLTMPKPLTVRITINLKILKEMGIADHLTCLLRNPYAGQEATVRTGHGTTHWFQIGKGVHQSCILSPCLLNLYAEYIMRNAGLEEAQAGIKTARRNINNLRYADDTTFMAESEEKLNSLLMRVKELA